LYIIDKKKFQCAVRAQLSIIRIKGQALSAPIKIHRVRRRDEISRPPTCSLTGDSLEIEGHRQTTSRRGGAGTLQK